MDRGIEWLSEYNRTIGGSRAAAVMGKSRFLTPLKLWRTMKGLDPQADLSGSPDIKRGLYLEPIARKLIEIELGMKVDTHPQDQFCYNPYGKYAWAHCLPDGWAGCPGTDAAGSTIVEEIPVEIKWPRPGKFFEALIYGPSEEHVIQCQHNMAVLDFDRILYVCGNCVTMDIMARTIVRDFDFTDQLMEREREFVESLKFDVPPQWIVDESEAKAPENPFGKEPDSESPLAVLTDPQAVALGIAWVEAKVAAAEAEKALDSAKDKLRELVPEGQGIEIPGVVRAYLSEIPGKITINKENREAALKRWPDLQHYLTIGKPSTQFRGYPLGEFKKFFL